MLAVAAALGLATGCNHQPPSAAAKSGQAATPADASVSSQPAGGGKSTSGLDPRKVLEEAMRAYGEAASYGDSGELRMRVVQNGEVKEPDGDAFSVTFARPNKLRLHLQAGVMICDGERMFGAVMFRKFANQILVLPDPPKLTLPFVYSNQVLAMAMQGGVELRPPQLGWLLSDTPPLDELGADAKLSLLEDAKLPGYEEICHRVQIETQEDTTTYWIDADSRLLRRVDYPTKHMLAKTDPAQGISKLEFWAEFKGAQFNPKLSPETFAFEAPRSAKLVKRFLPPPPVAPSPLLGQAARGYTFVDLDGESITSESLAGKVVVLDNWATWCGPCMRSMPNLEKVYQQFKNNDKVVILAVSADAPSTSNAEVKAALDRIGVHVPVARDPRKLADSVFRVEALPTTVIIGPDGKVQDWEQGARPDLADVLPKKIDALLAGTDLFPAELDRYEQEKRKYDAENADAMVGATGHADDAREIEVPEAPILPRSEPTTLKLSKLWSSNEVKFPGNLLLVGEGDERRVLVIENAQSIAELTTDGAVSARHALPIPPDVYVSHLRAAVDAQGARYFAVFASARQQVYLFDADWKLLASYPSDEKNSGVADAQLADLDGDGHLDLEVGYWGSTGVQTATLSGTLVRSNRSFENLMHLIVVGPQPSGQSRLLLANGQDSLHWLNAALESDGEIATPNRAVHTLLAHTRGAEITQIAALSSTEVGATTALGLTAAGQEQWAYDLPRGVQKLPVDTIVSLRTRSQPSAASEIPVSFSSGGSNRAAASDSGPAWLFPGPDGSLHFLGADGKLIDKFGYGAAISGLAWGELSDGRPALLVATPQEITAWGVEGE